MELINVKERRGFLVCFLIYFLIFLALSFTDAAIWNDGTHFLYQVINTGLFVDQVWHRYSDLLFQIPALASLSIFGLNPFAHWVFRATLYFLPLGVLFLGSFIPNSRSKHFIYAITLLILPVCLLFPISTINLSIVFGAVAMGISFKENYTNRDSFIYLICHVVIFYGHELGFAIPLVLLFHFFISLKKKEKYALEFFLFELIFIALFVYNKYELFISNRQYVSSLATSNFALPSLVFPILITSGILTLFRKSKFASIFAGITAFYLVLTVYRIDGYDFYFIISSARLSIALFVVLIFVLFQYDKDLKVTKSFVRYSLVMTVLVTFKVAIIWTNYEAPDTSVSGCHTLQTRREVWNLPEWTIPLYTMIKQYKLRPSSVWVATKDKNDTCLKFGDYFVLDNRDKYHFIGFHNRINGADVLNYSIQAKFDIPYKDETQRISLPSVAVVEFNNPNPGSSVNKCLIIEAHKISPTPTNMIVKLDGETKYEQPLDESIDGDFKLNFKIEKALKNVYVHVENLSPISIYIKSVTIEKCQGPTL